MDTPHQSARDRYHNDLHYRQLVDLMQSFINRAEFTPSEIREAAILASINYEMMYIRRGHLVMSPEVHEQLNVFHRMVAELPTREELEKDL